MKVYDFLMTAAIGINNWVTGALGRIAELNVLSQVTDFSD
jgi:hypothetical protein